MISAKLTMAKLYEHRNDQKNKGVIKEFTFHAKIISNDEWTTIHGWNKIIDDFLDEMYFISRFYEFSFH